jgi:hypothetical protein
MNVKRVAILQSNYLPWRGYFSMINAVDEFIFHDDLQYTKNDWRNRNIFKTPTGVQWLTVPVGTNEKRLINEVIWNDDSWKKNHCNRIIEWYKKAKNFEYASPLLEYIFGTSTGKNLSQVTNLSVLNQETIKYICREFLGVKTLFSNSTQYSEIAGKNQKILNLLKHSEATSYVSGPAARSYLDQNLLNENGITVDYFTYGHLRDYPQMYGDFQDNLSILDLLMNTGQEARSYL